MSERGRGNAGRAQGRGRGGRGRGGRGRARSEPTANNAVAEQSRATITEAQWEYLEARIAENHPTAGYSNEQMAFLDQFCTHGALNHDSRFALEMIVQEWCVLLDQNEEADLVAWRAMTVLAKKEYLMSLVPTLVAQLEARQQELADVSADDRPRSLFRWLELSRDAFNIDFLVELGMSLGFRYKPLQTSWHVAGKSYLLGQMCLDLFLALHPGAAQDVPHFDNRAQPERDIILEVPGVDEEEFDADAAVIRPVGTVHTDFIAQSTPAGMLKLCVFHIWHSKYAASERQAWAPNEMVNEWLKEGMAEYTRRTNNSFAPALFPDVCKTANGTWFQQLTAYASGASERQPDGNWYDALPLKPMLRKPWMMFYAKLILSRKVDPPANNRRASQPAGVSAAARSRIKRQRETGELPGEGRAPPGPAPAYRPGPIPVPGPGPVPGPAGNRTAAGAANVIMVLVQTTNQPQPSARRSNNSSRGSSSATSSMPLLTNPHYDYDDDEEEYN